MLQRRSSSSASGQGSRGDRRGASRYDTGRSYVLLNWTEGKETSSVVASLCDISLGGGSALAQNAPRVGSTAWFRLQGDDTSPWIAVTIVSHSKTGLLGFGPRSIRWKFSEPCPYQIFKAAINGFSTSRDVDDVTLPGYTRRDWRG